jgi:predicted dinucleotide-binding enzyme
MSQTNSDQRSDPMKVGIIGTGMIGGTLAKLLAGAGHQVVLANSRGPQTLDSLVAEIGTNAQAATVEDAATAGQVVVVAVPFKAVPDLPADVLEGKVVIDTTNYYEQRDGHIHDVAHDALTSSELTARALPGARVVKAFNTLYYQRLLDDGRPAGSPDRFAVLLAGDDAQAKAAVAQLIDDIGFDALDTGSLAEGGRRQQPGTPVYNRPLTKREAETELRAPS